MTNFNLELVIDHLLIPLFFGIVSLMLYVRMRYSYNCQSCGNFLKNRNKIIRCRYCKMQLCPRCRTKGFCPKCSKALTKEQQTKIYRSHLFYPLSVAIVMIMMFLLIGVGGSSGNLILVIYAGVFVIIYVCLGAVISKVWTVYALKTVKKERL